MKDFELRTEVGYFRIDLRRDAPIISSNYMGHANALRVDKKELITFLEEVLKELKND